MQLPDLDSLNYTLVLLTLIAIPIGWWRGWWESPKKRVEREQNKAMHDAILGTPPVPDRNNQVMTPGQPGLVHRVATVEDALVELTNVAAAQSKHQRQLDSHEARLGTHDQAIAALIAGSAERAATALSSAEMLRLIQERDTLTGDVTEPSGEL